MSIQTIPIADIIGSNNRLLSLSDEQRSDTLNPIVAHHLKEATLNNIGADSVYFSGDFPVIYFKKVQKFDAATIHTIAQIHKKIWNQSKASFLYVENEVEARVYNCVEQPVYIKNDDSTLFNERVELARFNKTLEADMMRLKEVFSIASVDSGDFWKKEEYAKKIDFSKKINKTLIQNLITTKKILKTEKGIEEKIIHDLLLRSLFILYLEDRGATEAAFYQQYQKNAKSYFDVLDDKEAVYQLFNLLEERFNGNLCPVSAEEKEIITTAHLIEIKKCFWSKVDAKNANQTQLFDWRVFDFSIIPIELISEIYEEFLTPVEQKNSGAFYTPNILVDFILNKVLPFPSANNHNYSQRILDPTCGSGIFLVQSLNRLLDRWVYAHPKKTLDFKTICNVVKDNIFGVEKNTESIKVAAFSLYLAMINRLSPKDLWKSVQFPYLIYSPDQQDKKKQGVNLFCMSSLADIPWGDISFDLVVGNPPFGTKNIDKETTSYLNKNKLPKEKVIAFLHKALSFAPKGKIALVATSKVLFNNADEIDKNFKKFLFQDNYVEEIHNFSIFAGVPKEYGKPLFCSANVAVSVFIYSKSAPSNLSPTILYCAPKTYFKNNVINGLAIDATDIKYIPRTEAKNPDTKIWKVAMWGIQRDFQFLRQLMSKKNIGELLEKEGVISGVGFELSKPKKPNEDIKNIPFIDADKLERYFTISFSAKTIENTLFYRLGTIQAYKLPHVLVKEGLANKKVCASFLDYDCSFLKTIYGIYHSDEKFLKLLTAYFNSTFAIYFLFLISSSLGIDRRRISPNEVLLLPNLLDRISSENQELIIAKFGELISLKKENKALNTAQINELESAIDALLMDALGFSKKEQILIYDTVNYTLDAFLNKDKSPAYKKVQEGQIQKHGTMLLSVLKDFLTEENQMNIWASYYLSSQSPLNVLAIHFNEAKPQGSVCAANADIQSVLKEIDAYAYQQFSEGIYFRKTIKYYTKDTVYLVKPNQQRFWMESAAMTDADEIIADMLNAGE